MSVVPVPAFSIYFTQKIGSICPYQPVVQRQADVNCPPQQKTCQVSVHLPDGGDQGCEIESPRLSAITDLIQFSPDKPIWYRGCFYWKVHVRSMDMST
jgi:hypothetical protein